MGPFMDWRRSGWVGRFVPVEGRWNRFLLVSQEVELLETTKE